MQLLKEVYGRIINKMDFKLVITVNIMDKINAGKTKEKAFCSMCFKEN